MLGSIGTFQDVPLSLQIVVRSEFFQLNRHGENLESGNEDSQMVGSTSAEHLKNVEAANDLLLWLSGGEAALIASRAAEKERKDKDTQIEESPTKAPVDSEDGDLDHGTKEILSSLDHIISPTSLELNVTASLQQPPAMSGRIELKR
jgi:hypothetical protein